MLKVKPAAEYPPEPGRYVRGNDYSPVAVCIILDTFDFAIPPILSELVLRSIDAGAAIAGMLQTENIGIEKIICNIVANPNIRYMILCGRESAGHLPGHSLIKLMQNGVDDNNRIIGSEALTPNLSNIPQELINRFREQITIINLLCKHGEQDEDLPGLNPSTIESGIKACYQEKPTQYLSYTVLDIGAYPEQPLVFKLADRLRSNSQPTQAAVEPGKPNIGTGLVLHKLLPRTDCRQCGKKNCLAFALDLAKGNKKIEDCPIILQPEFNNELNSLKKLLS